VWWPTAWTDGVLCCLLDQTVVADSSWNVIAHSDAHEGWWRGNWRMEWVASTLHTTSEHGVSSTTTADAHTSAASSGLNWSPCRFNPLNAEFNPIFHLLALLGAHHILHVSRIRVKWTRPFRRKTKSGFCACAVTFEMQSIVLMHGDHACHKATPNTCHSNPFQLLFCGV
jgi:hypothetical protein